MFTFLSEILQKKHIDTFAPIPLSACKTVRPYLLEREGIADGTVIVLAIPYYTHACKDPARNLSAYAVSKDYHLFFASLFDELLPLLRARFPMHRFAGFADHAPIDEIHAAAAAGLGVLGENNLLLTEPYSSYVFLGEIITDAHIPCEPKPLRHCDGCTVCRRACPARGGALCLSELTQKKGALTADEEQALLAHNTVWGCDICQEVCPYTRRALARGTIFSPIPFFNTDTIPRLTSELLEKMSEAEFQARAYAWRKRETIGRNLKLKEKGELSCSN